MFDGPEISWFALSPMLVLVGTALVLLVGGALLPRWPRGSYAFVTAAAAGAAAVLAMVLWGQTTDDGPSTLVGGALAFDAFAMFVTITICAGLLLVSLVADDYLRREDLDGPEVYALMLVAATGGIVMGAANDLIVLFIGLETLSLAFYVLSASYRRKAGSSESGIKYFILGGFSSAFFLYGIALVYGALGSTNLSNIVGTLSSGISLDRNDALVLAGTALLLVGLGFKVAAVPFHVWTPDVYQGAPTPVTALDGLGRQGRRVRRARCASWWWRCRSTATTGDRSCGHWRSSRWSSAPCSPSCRPTSSGCSPTRRSTTPASSSSASRPPRTGRARSTAGSACRARWCTSWPTSCSSSARSPSSPWSPDEATSAPGSTPSAGCRATARRSPWR